MAVNSTDVNNASLPTQPKLRFSSLEKIACYSTIYGFISLIALVGNILVCFVIIKNPRMRTVTNVFLLNLAVADILFITVTVPGVMNLQVIRSYWVFGELLCKTIPFVNTVTLSTSIYTMVVLAIDRYYAVVQPLRARLRHTVKRTSCLITLIWVSSVVVASPQIPSRVLLRFPNLNAIYCANDWKKLGGKLGLQIYSVAIFFVFFAVPITIITLAYSSIIAKLQKTDAALRDTFKARQGRSRKENQPNQEGSIVLSRNNRRTTFMMLTVIIVFLICMLPFNVFILVSTFLSDEKKAASGEVLLDVQSVLTVFAIASSACNPVIYNFFSLKFRRAFSDVFRCKCKNETVMRTDMTSEFNRL